MKPHLKRLLALENFSLKKVLKIIQKNSTGTAFIISKKKELKGLITDGDIRRVSNNSLKDKNLNKIIRSYPYVISENVSAQKALSFMSEKKITSLLVVSDKDKNKEKKSLKGIIHIHFLLRDGVR